MANIDKIVAHRGLILTALKVYKGEVEKAIKQEEKIEADTSDTERKLEIIEMLSAEFVDQKALLLEGTPMGEALTDAAYTTTDGTVLTADVMEGLLRNVGIDAPFEAIAGWTKAQRESLNDWAATRLQAVIDDEPLAPLHELIAESWLTNSDELLERPMPEAEVDEWISKGPWGVRGTPGVAPGEPDEWQVYVPEIRETDPPHGVTAEERAHGQTYGQLDRARLVAANLNAIELGKALASAHAVETPDISPAVVEDNGTTNEEEEPGEEAEEKPRTKKRLQHRRVAVTSEAARPSALTEPNPYG